MVTDERIKWVGLPKININTQTNATAGFTPFAMSSVDKVTKRNCSATFTDAYGSNFFPGGFTTNITIKGRGNYTWGRPKRPYNIVICGATNFTKRNVAMFGLPADSDWSLLADYDDFTHSRAILASAMSFCLGQWCSRMLKVELYFNDIYQGLYTFCEKVSRTADRINIKKLDATDITGGYVLEGTMPSYVDASLGEKSFVDARFGHTYTYKVPDADSITDAQNAYAEQYFNDFIRRLHEQPLGDLANGYRAVADPVSLAQYYLIQDIIKNADFNSFYLTKDRGELLKGGPFWDAGIAFAIYETPPQNVAEDTYQERVHPLFVKLLGDPYFMGVVRQQFATALPKLHQAVADIRDFNIQLRGVATQDESGRDAIERDAARWASSNTSWPGNYDRNFPALLKFCRDRLFWQYRRYYFPLNAASATVTARP